MSPASQSAAAAGRSHALAVLRHRDFRLLWLGALVSTIGDQMQTIGIAWHVYLITASPLNLGLIGLFRAVPFMGLSLAGGALADEIDRKRLLLITQGSQMLFTGVLVAATFSGHATVWLLYAITFLSGAASAFDGPARQALVPNLVPRAELSAGLTVMTLLRRTAMIVGPGLGGLIIARYGLGADYLGNAISFLAVVVAVLLLGPVPRLVGTAVDNWDRLLGGLRFARAEPLVLWPMLLDFVTRVVGNWNVLLPIYAADIFHTGATGLGVMTSAVSVGAVAGGLTLGSMRPVKHPIALMIAAYMAEGTLFVAFGAAGAFGLIIGLLFLRGIVNVVSEVLRVTVLQLKTPDDVRGRVTALSNMFDYGGPQVGQLEAGLVTDAVGPPAAAFIGGLASCALCVAFVLLPPLRKGLWVTSDEYVKEQAA